MFSGDPSIKTFYVQGGGINDSMMLSGDPEGAFCVILGEEEDGFLGSRLWG